VTVAILGVMSGVATVNIGHFFGAGQEEAKGAEGHQVEVAALSYLADGNTVSESFTVGPETQGVLDSYLIGNLVYSWTIDADGSVSSSDDEEGGGDGDGSGDDGSGDDGSGDDGSGDDGSGDDGSGDDGSGDDGSDDDGSDDDGSDDDGSDDDGSGDDGDGKTKPKEPKPKSKIKPVKPVTPFY
jgi:hypothetical protein